MAKDAIPRRGFLKGAAGAAAATVLSGHSEPAHAQRHRSGIPLRRLRHLHSGRQAVALGHRLRPRHLYGPPTRGLLGQRLAVLTPREYFAAGIKAANAWTHKTYGKDFDRLGPSERDAALKMMEADKAEFADFNAKPFFEALYQSAMEGFFADPIYGGNRNKAGWAIIGFPGIIAVHRDHVAQYRGKPFPNKPLGIADMS